MNFINKVFVYSSNCQQLYCWYNHDEFSWYTHLLYWSPHLLSVEVGGTQYWNFTTDPLCCNLSYFIKVCIEHNTFMRCHIILERLEVIKNIDWLYISSYLSRCSLYSTTIKSLKSPLFCRELFRKTKHVLQMWNSA